MPGTPFVAEVPRRWQRLPALARTGAVAAPHGDLGRLSGDEVDVHLGQPDAGVGRLNHEQAARPTSTASRSPVSMVKGESVGLEGDR